jgi:hypothetical protein
MSGRALIRVPLNVGLRKPRRGFTRVAGKKKLGVDKVGVELDTKPIFVIVNLAILGIRKNG